MTGLAAESRRSLVATVAGTDLVAESRRIPVATVMTAARSFARCRRVVASTAEHLPAGQYGNVAAADVAVVMPCRWGVGRSSIVAVVVAVQDHGVAVIIIRTAAVTEWSHGAAATAAAVDISAWFSHANACSVSGANAVIDLDVESCRILVATVAGRITGRAASRPPRGLPPCAAVRRTIPSSGVVVVASTAVAAAMIVVVPCQHVNVERVVAGRSTLAAVSIVVAIVCAIASSCQGAAAAAAAGVVPAAAGSGWPESAPGGLWYVRDLAQGRALGAGLLPGAIPLVRLA